MQPFTPSTTIRGYAAAYGLCCWCHAPCRRWSSADSRRWWPPPFARRAMFTPPEDTAATTPRAERHANEAPPLFFDAVILRRRHDTPPPDAEDAIAAADLWCSAIADTLFIINFSSRRVMPRHTFTPRDMRRAAAFNTGEISRHATSHAMPMAPGDVTPPFASSRRHHDITLLPAVNAAR